MTYQEMQDALAAGAVLVDGRSPEEFAQGHLRQAVNIGLEGRYAEFAGSVVKPDVDIVLMTQPGQELEGKNRLARIGFDRVIGYLDQPEQAMLEHPDQVQVASRLSVKDFGERTTAVRDLQIVDVRNPGEADAGMIPGAVNIPVGQLPDRVGELNPAAPTVVYCAGGYRSSVAASLLRQNGFSDVSDILGGFNAWDEAHQNA
jgi:rhodanese-related sulfurtransferase